MTGIYVNGAIAQDGTCTLSFYVTMDASRAAATKYTVDWGDGSPAWTQTGGAVPSAQAPIKLIHPYAAHGAHTATVSVDDGSGSGPVTIPYGMVWHYATAPTMPGLAVDKPGGNAPFTVNATISGGTVDPAATKTYYVDFGDGTPVQKIPAPASGSVKLPHTYTAIGQYRITALTYDGVDFSSSNNLPSGLVVTAYGVTLQARTDQYGTTYLNWPYALGAPLAYPHTYDMYIDWGDGKSESDPVSSSTYHNYAKAGTYTISVKMADSSDPNNTALPQYFATTTVTTTTSVQQPAPQTGPTVVRTGGIDRYLTAVGVSEMQWAPGSANAVVLARGDAAPDALAGVPLAAHVHGPLLLTDPNSLQSLTRTEIDRVLGGPQSKKTVYILGGSGAVSQSVEDALRTAGYVVVRLGGASRFETALKIAGQFGSTQHVVVATGLNFPDALAAGPLGAAENAPIVLTSDTATDPATAAFIRQHAAVDPVGRQAQLAIAKLGISGQTVDQTLAGADRYATATAVAARFAAVTGKAPAAVGLASGVTFPDALTGGAFCANAGQPLVLTDPLTLSPETTSYLGGLWHAGSLKTVDIFGREGAVSKAIETAIAAL